MRRVLTIMVVATSLLGAACSSAQVIDRSSPSEPLATSTAATEMADSTLAFAEVGEDEAKRAIIEQFYADIPIDRECMVDQFADVSVDDLAEIGITSDGMERDSIARLFLAMGEPIYDAFVLGYSTFSTAFDETVRTDLRAHMSESQIECYLEGSRRNVEVVTVHMFGTETGSKGGFNEAPEPIRLAIQSGLDEHDRLVTTCT